MPRRRSIKEQLIRHIKDAGLSRVTFCEKAGIDTAQLSRLFSGDRDPSLKTIEKLCKYLKLELVKIQKQHEEE